jgi:hypothetical protein
MSVRPSRRRVPHRLRSSQHRSKLGFGRAFPVGRNRDESAYFTASFKAEPASAEVRIHQQGRFRYHLEDRPFDVVAEPAHGGHKRQRLEPMSSIDSAGSARAHSRERPRSESFCQFLGIGASRRRSTPWSKQSQPFRSTGSTIFGKPGTTSKTKHSSSLMRENLRSTRNRRRGRDAAWIKFQAPTLTAQRSRAQAVGRGAANLSSDRARERTPKKTPDRPRHFTCQLTTSSAANSKCYLSWALDDLQRDHVTPGHLSRDGYHPRPRDRQ